MFCQQKVYRLLTLLMLPDCGHLLHLVDIIQHCRHGALQMSLCCTLMVKTIIKTPISVLGILNSVIN